MPIKGGKLWFAAVAGILLGFVLFGMLSRGRSVEGSRADQAGALSAAPAPAVRSNGGASSIRANRREAPEPPSRAVHTRPDPNQRRENAKSRAANRTVTTSPRDAARDRRRETARAEFERQQELARQTRERAIKHRQRNEQFLASGTEYVATTTGAAPPAQEEQALADASQMQADQRAAQPGGGGDGPAALGGEGAPRAGGDGSGAGEGPGSDDASSDPEGWDEIAALLEGLGLDQSLVDLVKQVVSTGVGVPNNFSGGGGGGGGTGDNGSGGGGGSGGSNPPDTRPVIARWLTVPRDGCSKAGLSTRDLYIGFLTAPSPPIMTSDQTNGIRIVGGAFTQEAGAGNGPPAVLTGSCASFDSFLTAGGIAPVFAPIPPTPDVANWGSRLMASWFGIFGVKVERDTARFGDNRHYVWIGRFTAEKDAYIFGRLRIDTLTTAFIDVPDWAGKATDSVAPEPPPLPRLDSLQVSGESIIGGESVLATLRLDRPAPESGVVAFLSSNRPSQIGLPEQVEILPGATFVNFEVLTKKVAFPASAVISATYAGRTVSTPLTVEAPSVNSITITKSRLVNRETAQVTLWLNSPAPAGGTQIVLLHDSPGALDAPSLVRVPEGQLRTRFTVTGGRVSQSKRVTIFFSAAGRTRTAMIDVVPLATAIDVNSDEVIDTADLGLLLGAFGSNNPNYDFNGDGKVDTADLGLLSGAFGQTVDDDGGPGGGDDGGPRPDPEVLARWVDIDREECSDKAGLSGARTADLYLGFRSRPSPPVITSKSAQGLRIAGGSFKQLLLNPNGNAPPGTAVLVPGYECSAYDSFLTVGGASPNFIGDIGQTPEFAGAPDPSNWGATLLASWFVVTGVDVQQDFEKFGDLRHYVWIGRFSAPADAIISGQLRVDTRTTAIVDVPDWSTAASPRLDFNGDGSVTSADVAYMTRHIGDTNQPTLDLNANGVIDGHDLRPLLKAIGRDE